MNKEDIEGLNKDLKGKSSKQILLWAFEKFGKKIVFASSFGAEDVVLIDMIAKIKPDAKIITLDTGRLPKETYELIEDIARRYKVKIATYFPDSKEVENLVKSKGFFSFKKSVENRRECCRIRKVNPLKRALKGIDAWITGLRRAQSVTRQEMRIVELDNQFSLIKINPLAEWSEKDVWDYIKEHNVPYNKLHDMNYPSIGCEPCTKAIKKGEDIRAGRWWWEEPEKKECGLHAHRLKNESSK